LVGEEVEGLAPPLAAGLAPNGEAGAD